MTYVEGLYTYIQGEHVVEGGAVGDEQRFEHRKSQHDVQR